MSPLAPRPYIRTAPTAEGAVPPTQRAGTIGRQRHKAPGSPVPCPRRPSAGTRLRRPPGARSTWCPPVDGVRTAGSRMAVETTTPEQPS